MSTTSEYAQFVHDRALERRAADKAARFVREEREFQLGHLPTEQPHPYTERFSAVVRDDAGAGVELLLKVDGDIPAVARRILLSPEFDSLVAAIEISVRTDRKICFSGCGSTGRLAMILEEMWRQYWEDKAGMPPGEAARTTGSGNPLLAKAEQAASIMTGGDRALIRAVESFEDHAAYGRRQVADLGLQRGDLLIAISEGGETSSVIGTAEEGLHRGCDVLFVYNNPTSILVKSIERSRRLIGGPGVTTGDLYTGAMSLTGSTRMQATTIEMFVVGAAMEEAFRKGEGHTVSTANRLQQADRLAELLCQLGEDHNVKTMGNIASKESRVYSEGGRVTYLASRFLLDVFSDTTERSPTFMLPPFRPTDDQTAPNSWAYAKDPSRDSSEAWFTMLRRAPRGIDWTNDDYRRMGTLEKLRFSPPSLGADEIARYVIGNEPDPSRSAVTPYLFLTILVGDADDRDGPVSDVLRLGPMPESRTTDGTTRRQSKNGIGDEYRIVVDLPESPILLWHHIATKLVMNTISTASMGIMDRIRGNWMVQLDPTNKKLIDRGSRIIAHLCGLDYETACYELHRSLFSREKLREDGGHSTTSPVVDALGRLSGI